MNNLTISLAVLQIIFAIAVHGQEPIVPRELQISSTITTNVIFKEPILSVDLGSEDLLAQRAQGVDNILQVKAANEDFPRTNLTVITSDGTLHSFWVNYEESPDKLNYLVPHEAVPKYHAIPGNGEPLPADVRECADWVRLTDLEPFHIRRKSQGVQLSTDGIFISSNRMYVRLRVYNGSNIPFDPDRTRFFLRDSRRTKRTALQEMEVVPDYVIGAKDRFAPYIPHTMVAVFPKFTFSRGKFLSVEVSEPNGGRRIDLKIRHGQMSKVLQIPFYN